jgi:MoxR-like ATPase
MFNIWVDYPSYAEEVEIVKSTTSSKTINTEAVIHGDEIIFYQQLIRKMPVADNVVEYAVKLVGKTRPGSPTAPEMINNFLSWGAGPRASQYLIIGAKCHAALSGKYSPDIEDVRAVALPILRHRMVRNYKAEAEGYTVERIVGELL